MQTTAAQPSRAAVYQNILNEIPTSRKHSGNRVIRFFPDTHLGNGHQGLKVLAEKAGVNVEKLGWGEFVIFMNSKCSAIKLYSQGNLVAHLKMPGDTRIDMRTIALIPRFFNGTTIDYQGSLEEVIRKTLRK